MRFAWWLPFALLAAEGCGSTPDGPVPATIPASEVHVIESAIVGDRFRLSIALPSSYERSDESYPVVYALDANSWFGTYADVARVGAAVGELPETIVVGIGYPAASSGVVRALRARDFTPARRSEQDARIREFAPELSETVVSGGAEAFLRCLREEVVPFVEGRYRAAPSRSVLFGHSFGGLFALHVLLEAPEAFSGYVIGSPSIWYDDRLELTREGDYAAAHRDLRARVFLAVGGLEERGDDPKVLEAAMVSNVVELARRLEARGYPGLELESLVFDGETHNGVVPPTFSRGLRYVFAEGRATSSGAR